LKLGLQQPAALARAVFLHRQNLQPSHGRLPKRKIAEEESRGGDCSFQFYLSKLSTIAYLRWWVALQHIKRRYEILKTLFTSCALLLCVQCSWAADGNTFNDAEVAAIQPFLDKCVGHSNSAMVIGLVDEKGTKIFSAEQLENGTNGTVSGDTVFLSGLLPRLLPRSHS
jgi:hypothetical protein